MFRIRTVLRVAGVLALAHLATCGGAAANPLGIPDSEYDALVALYNATNGPNWLNNTNWLTWDRPWHGVTVEGGHVTELSLSLNKLTGSIPPELGNLANLNSLYLGFNQLTGSIPPELGNLAKLEFLRVDESQLTGSIPPELGNLASLWYLRLDNNQLSGSIPPELGNLANLEFLYLFGNQLTGSIPAELGNMANLRLLYLSANRVTGSIPPELGHLANLQSLTLCDNQLTGSIPPEMGDLANLTYLRLQSNQLTGSIPPEMGNLTNLTVAHGLDLGYNGLFTADAGLAAFVDAKSYANGDWRATQTVAPTDIAAAPPVGNSVSLSWTPILYTADSGHYEVGVSPSADGPFTYDPADRTWDKSATGIVVKGLAPGENYLVVRAVTLPHDLNQNMVAGRPSTPVSATVIGIVDAASIGASKLLEDGTWVRVQGVTVTAGDGQIDGVGYVEQPDRSSGIALQSTFSAATGDRVDVSGVMGTTADGERVINQAYVEINGTGDTLPPLSMSLKTLAGGPWFYDPATGSGQRGVTDPRGKGMSTTGLLVEVTGWVWDMDASFIYVNDGAWYGTTGIRVSRAHVPVEVGLGSCVRVRGISSMRRAGPAYQLVLKPRSVGDIQVVYQP